MKWIKILINHIHQTMIDKIMHNLTKHNKSNKPSQTLLWIPSHQQNQILSQWINNKCKILKIVGAMLKILKVRMNWTFQKALFKVPIRARKMKMEKRTSRHYRNLLKNVIRKKNWRSNSVKMVSTSQQNWTFKFQLYFLLTAF